VLAALAAGQRLEPVVSTPLRCRATGAEGGHRRVGSQALDRSVALAGARGVAGGGAAVPVAAGGQRGAGGDGGGGRGPGGRVTQTKYRQRGGGTTVAVASRTGPAGRNYRRVAGQEDRRFEGSCRARLRRSARERKRIRVVPLGDEEPDTNRRWP